MHDAPSVQTLTAALQGALNIDAQKKMKWWNELHAAKREGTLAPKCVEGVCGVPNFHEWESPK